MGHRLVRCHIPCRRSPFKRDPYPQTSIRVRLRSPLPTFHLSRPRHSFAKYFGSGVIIATAFIHLLAPAYSELTSPCLGAAWQDYVRHSPQLVPKLIGVRNNLALPPSTCSPIVLRHIHS